MNWVFVESDRGEAGFSLSCSVLAFNPAWAGNTRLECHRISTYVKESYCKPIVIFNFFFFNLINFFVQPLSVRYSRFMLIFLPGL